MNKKQIIKRIEDEISETNFTMHDLVDQFINDVICESHFFNLVEKNKLVLATLDELLEDIKGE